MQHEAAAEFDRAAEMDRHVVGAPLRSRPRAASSRLSKRQAVDQAVHHQPHRAVGRMRAQIDHAPRKARIRHLRHRDQQLTGQRAVIGEASRRHAATLRASDAWPARARRPWSPAGIEKILAADVAPSPGAVPDCAPARASGPHRGRARPAEREDPMTIQVGDQAARGQSQAADRRTASRTCRSPS